MREYVYRETGGIMRPVKRVFRHVVEMKTVEIEVRDLKIRDQYDSGESQAELAKRYRLSQQQISRILKNKRTGRA